MNNGLIPKTPTQWVTPINDENHEPIYGTGHLSGLRLAVKDVFDIAGMPTSAGNPDWLATHSTPMATHSSVVRMIAEGAQFVGKTITDELAYSLNGQNMHYGTPTNYSAPNRLPGGSSSGSAAAVNSGWADIGLGTDTGGSIRVPASYNGLFGLRTTHGAIAKDNMVALAPSFDTVGFLTLSMRVMSKVTQLFLKPAAAIPRSPRVGLLTRLVSRADHESLINQWVKENLPTAHEVSAFDAVDMGLSDAFSVLQGAEIWQQHGAWLRKHTPVISQDIGQRLERCALISSAQLTHAEGVRAQFMKKIAVLFSQYDVLVLPTTPGIAPLLSAKAEQLGDYRKQLLALTSIAGLAGVPQLHLPLFTLNNAPCGLSLIGPRGSDAALIALAKNWTE